MHWPLEHFAVLVMHGSAKQRTPGPEHAATLSVGASATQLQPVQ